MLETTQPQAEQPANQPEMHTAPEQSGDRETSGPFMTVRYNKEDRPLDKEAAVMYAQKGMNYDKLSEKLSRASAKLAEYEAAGQQQENGGDIKQPDADDAKQAAVENQLEAFIRENPGVDPRQLPEAVLDGWKKGTPLAKAYDAYQARQLKQQVNALQKAAEQAKTNAANAAASMGSAQSSGQTRQKALSEETIRNMTPEELDRNHERIWAYLTGTKKKKG